MTLKKALLAISLAGIVFFQVGIVMAADTGFTRVCFIDPQNKWECYAVASDHVKEIYDLLNNQNAFSTPIDIPDLGVRPDLAGTDTGSVVYDRFGRPLAK